MFCRDADAAKRRLDFIRGIPVLQDSDEIAELAEIYQHLLGVPERAKTDCLHLASCVLFEIDYLLSWNCTHLGIHSYAKMQRHNEQQGLFIPLLLTPEALVELDGKEKLL